MVSPHLHIFVLQSEEKRVECPASVSCCRRRRCAPPTVCRYVTATLLFLCVKAVDVMETATINMGSYVILKKNNIVYIF